MITAAERLQFLARRIYHRARRDVAAVMHPIGARADIEFWEELRGRHTGRAGFVIGCGPSLCASDLDQLRGELTLASNRINLAFDQTDWRPDYFAISDWVLFPKIKRHLADQYELVLGGPDMPRRLSGTRMVRWHWLGQPHGQPTADGEYCFSDNASQGIWSGGTITFDLMQIAAHMGCDRIVLIGCDHQYEGEDDIDPRDLMETPPNVQNHFDDQYRMPGERVRPACLNLMTRAFRHAKAWSDATGVQIVNATRGGALDIFPRVTLEEVLAEQPTSSMS